MPTYEPDPNHIREAVESVINQTERDWTLIIHDDASKAHVKAMIDEFLWDPRITFSRSKKRLGIGGNWNACLKKATAPYVQYLFQDDAWETTYLEKSIAALDSEPSVGLVAVGHHYQFDAHDSVPGTQMPSIYHEVLAEQLLLTAGIQNGPNFVLTWAEKGLRPNIVGEPSFVMIRTVVANAAGPFREDLPQGLDIEYWIRLLCRSDIFIIKDHLGFFRVHEKAASSQNNNAGAGLTDRLRCFEVLVANTPDTQKKKRAKAAARKALQHMMAKYFHRTRAGGGTGGLDKKFLAKFCLRHPLMVTRALLKSRGN
ncbi:MAG: glycosyl transferase family protein [Candidatus Peribacteria bacterium]|nr:glycosyl transferase family protein [Candidatus Peribacteria bacterium]